MKVEEEEIFELINSKMDIEEVKRKRRELKKGKSQAYKKILDEYIGEIAKARENLSWKIYDKYLEKYANLRKCGTGFYFTLWFGWLAGFSIGRAICDISKIPYTSPQGALYQLIGIVVPPLIGGIGTLYCKNMLSKYERKYRKALIEAMEWLKLSFNISK